MSHATPFLKVSWICWIEYVMKAAIAEISLSPWATERRRRKARDMWPHTAAALNGQGKEKVTLGLSKRGPIHFLVKLALIGSVPRGCGGTTAAAFQGRRGGDDERRQ